MVEARRRPPTTKQLLLLLGKVRVRVISKFSDPAQTGEWRPDETDTEFEGTLVVSSEKNRKQGMDGLIVDALHELVHAFFQVNCNDDRTHHDKVYRWESVMFRSRALREAMAVRVGNAYIFGVEEP